MDRTTHRCRTIRTQVTVDANRRVSYYAALFNEQARVYDFKPGAMERSQYMEVVRPGAFTDALSSNQEVVANIDHDDRRIFARRSTGDLLLAEDPKGLFASAWIPEGDQGDGIIADIQSGKLDGTSFKFLPQQERWDGDTCELLSVQLFDCCLTASPAYDTRGEVHLRTQRNYVGLMARLGLLKLKQR